MNTSSATRKPFHKLHATLDSDAVADDDIVLDQAVRADVAVVADLCASQHDDELPDARARADGGGLDVCEGMDEGGCHSLGYSVIYS